MYLCRYKKNNMRIKGLFTLLGFMLFLFGFTSLMLSLVGVRYSFLAWLDNIGSLFGFVVKLLMVVGGLVIAILARTDWDRERRESSNDVV